MRLPTAPAVPQGLRYSVISAICLLLGTILIPLFSRTGLHYAVATFVAFLLVALIGFFLHSVWTFRVERTLASLVRYVSAMALNLPLMILLIAVGHDLLGLSVAVSTAIASAALFAWNFLAVRWAVLRPHLGGQR